MEVKFSHFTAGHNFQTGNLFHTVSGFMPRENGEEFPVEKV